MWIIANWKSNKNITEALSWVDEVGPQIPRNEALKVVVCPTVMCIEDVKKAVIVNGYHLTVGAQDLSSFDEGAYTGEEAARILKDVVDISILGHSERRQHFNETDETVAEKVAQAKQYNIESLVCCQDENTPVPLGVKLVAYEPVFAIGTGTPDTPQNANNVAKLLKDKHGSELEVLYGGSVTSENAKAYLSQENISGLLIGKSSLDTTEFIKIVEIADNLL
ncbi:MAG: triose-phosphate isomerase [Candidatus Daviesbacteria bacterium]|nr:triose-phosphate isomerase [Candidatus Daviesbacteria bacterium]